MNDIKIKFSVIHKPMDTIGIWGDSTLTLFLKTDRETVTAVEKAIRGTLGRRNDCHFKGISNSFVDTVL